MSGIRFDDREFTDTLRKLATLSSKELPEFVNGRMLAITTNARAMTPIADRGQILSTLGATMTSERPDKNGRMRRKYSYSPTPLVYGIVNARRRRAGMAPIPRGEMAAAAKNLIAGRLRAVGSLRSGWTRAIAILAASIKKGVGSAGGPGVKMQSKATPARNGLTPTAFIEYRETVERSGIKFVDPRVELALEAAFAREQGEMLRHLDSKMNDVAKRAGAK